ncbi:sulfite exporter TauE/SafE family protein [Gaoshiqia sp. Z1-71]|uniref:sulfite exporter TauE/SafE family protein n=1 Tax=Gaoshiqia hydrogeniformans TaxID=3290090 RepID=UPI003BF8CFB5
MEFLFLLILLVISFLYASVGHGGASGYLALMALFGMEASVMRPSALTLNLFVSFIAFFSFYQGGYLRWKLLFPFIITSIPMSYWGAGISIDQRLYKYLLGICLIAGIGRMLFMPDEGPVQNKKVPFPAGLVAGAALGFISGLIGIGGGVILSPLLILFRWADQKETAAVSSVFIFLNSASGLLGLNGSGPVIGADLLTWVAVAVIGGIAGSAAGSFKLNPSSLKYILAGVLLMASIKLFVI